MLLKFLKNNWYTFFLICTFLRGCHIVFIIFYSYFDFLRLLVWCHFDIEEVKNFIDFINLNPNEEYLHAQLLLADLLYQEVIGLGLEFLLICFILIFSLLFFDLSKQNKFFEVSANGR